MFMTEDRTTLRFFIRTFGCQMNESDSERIAGLLCAAGARKSDCPEEADLLIVNTCAVREKSEEKLYSYLGRLARLKKKKPVRIAVVGCVAQLRGGALVERQPGVDLVLGPDNCAEIVAWSFGQTAEKCVSTAWSKEWHETSPELISRKSTVSAYVTVMEGCNNFCAYCVVPFTRGREKYRPLRSILEEIRNLADRGFKEIQLLGQNVNQYRDPESKRGFVSLLREAAAADGIEWIRFLTSHPKYFTMEIASAMCEIKKVCRHLHLPLQSGSTAVLKRMRRGYSKKEYLDKISALRRLMPEIGLTTDIIVGFPGETEKDFEETLDVLERIGFASIFSFRYSPRPLTQAAGFTDDVPPADKQKRLVEVQRLQKDIQLRNHARQVGKVKRILCLGTAKRTPDLYYGRDEGNLVVNFHSAEGCIGSFTDVRITGFGAYSLRGERLVP
jgi:tRNA-2-methylthio-N6-dimethylallyladenosine synthase